MYHAIIVIVLILIVVGLILALYFSSSGSPEMMKRVTSVVRPPDPYRKIPSTIHQIHYSDMTTKNMAQAVDSWLNLNPTYSYYFFTDQQCRNFIKEHAQELPAQCLDAYDMLIPGAYRADLARACLVYINGGFYIDAGHVCYVPLNKYLSAQDDLVLVSDNNDPGGDKGGGLHNAFFGAIPRCHLIRGIIELIIKRVTARDYGENRINLTLYPTGPHAYGDALASYLGREGYKDYQPGMYSYKNLQIRMGQRVEDSYCGIVFDGVKTCRKYDNYVEDQKWLRRGPYYKELYRNRYIFRERMIADEEGHVPLLNNIPLVVHQRNETMYVTPKMFQATSTWRDAIHEMGGKYYYYDNESSREFIKKHFDESVLQAYDALACGAYRADLFKYCCLYVHGGVVADTGQVLGGDLRDLYNTGSTFVSATDDVYGILCGLIVAVPKHPIIAETIRLVCERIHKREYGPCPLYPTGPIPLGAAARMVLKLEPMAQLEDRSYGSQMHLCTYIKSSRKVYCNNNLIMYKYPDYESERPLLYQEDTYWSMWEKRQIYR